jgi:hypothetical protein
MDAAPSVVMPVKSARQRDQDYRSRKQAQRIQDIAILDMETDPFDKVKQDEVLPFLAVLHSDQFDDIVIWDETKQGFIDKVIASILALPRQFTIYAHNGGKFDFMFLISALKGRVTFKGRGIMSAKLGDHELRDSFHIIPEKLAKYKKDTFDYKKLYRAVRNKWREEIIAYCKNDCRFLLDLVKKFLAENGFKISIGAAAIAKVKEDYKLETLSNYQDAAVREFYYGGFVSCISGVGLYSEPFALYDVNSMYPAVMAHVSHPVGSEYIDRPGEPGGATCFVELECLSLGAFAGIWGRGRFKTSIHEFQMAMKLRLIEDIKIIRCLDNINQTNFAKFVLPLYEKRQKLKEQMDVFERVGDTESPEYYKIKADALIIKLLLNNAYGKFASNPRKYKDHYLTEPGLRPGEDKETWGFAPTYEGGDYWVWSRPIQQQRFLNVGTAASITGAARAKLMEAIHYAKNPIYCDTDSLICEELRNVEIHPAKLGTWKMEAKLTDVIICGKKLYCYRSDKGKETFRSKGTEGLVWKDYEAMLTGSIIPQTAFGPTLTRRGDQHYMMRRIRATGLTPEALAAIKTISSMKERA